MMTDMTNCQLGYSSFHGNIKEIPGIAVDNFNNLECRAYFLSHCHSDHTEGLFSNKLYDTIKQNNVFIYMSDVTASIIIKSCKDIEEHIKRLQIGSNYICLPKLFDYEEQYINVITTPAGHCFGSVMFLFRTSNKTILYTGDFRIKESDVSKHGHLHDSNNEPIIIDAMYVDTTFLNHKYTSFPKRSTSIKLVTQHIEDWLGRDTENAVALSTPAKFGYEFVFNEISKSLNCKVYVNKEKYRHYISRDYPNMVTGVTNDETETKIHVCYTCKETDKHNLCIENYKNKNFLVIRLTAMKWVDYDLEESPVNRVSENKLYACFPTHCSRSELIYFVHYFEPKKVIGFPEEYKEKRRLLNKMSPIKTQEINIKKLATKRKSNIELKSPNKVHRKVPTNVLREMFKL